MNFFREINDITNHVFSLPVPTVVDGIGLLGVIIAICVPVLLALFIARFRSWFASLWFLPAFLMALQYIVLNVPAVKDYLTSDSQMAQGLLFGILVICIPVNVIHYIFIAFLESAITFFDIKNIVESQLFALIFYAVLFVLFFLIFKKRKHKRSRRYSDDF